MAWYRIGQAQLRADAPEDIDTHEAPCWTSTSQCSKCVALFIRPGPRPSAESKLDVGALRNVTVALALPVRCGGPGPGMMSTYWRAVEEEKSVVSLPSVGRRDIGFAREGRGRRRRWGGRQYLF